MKCLFILFCLVLLADYSLAYISNLAEPGLEVPDSRSCNRAGCVRKCNRKHYGNDGVCLNLLNEFSGHMEGICSCFINVGVCGPEHPRCQDGRSYTIRIFSGEFLR